MMNDVKQTISDTMKQLMQKKSIDKITVKELVEQSGISRQTFYYHFRDILDVIEWSFEQRVLLVADECSKMTDIQASIKLFADEVEETYSGMRKLLNSKLRAETETILVKSIRRFLNLMIQAKFADTNWGNKEKRFLVEFFSCGMAAYFVEQCTSSRKTDTETFSREMYRLIQAQRKFEGSE